jgi:galactofuranose transport system substrate-binding protein
VGSSSRGGASTSGSAAGTTSPAASAAAAGCAATDQGYPKLALAGAKVGFSQSEPETAAFRIAETRSIKDEAKAQGVTLIHTDADSKIDKQVSDIKGMLAQGVKLLIIARLTPTACSPPLTPPEPRRCRS